MENLSQRMAEEELVSVLSRFHSPVSIFASIHWRNFREGERMESGRRVRKSEDDSKKV